MGQRVDGVRVMVVDDDPSMRLVARVMLGLEPDVAVIGEAADGDGALRLAAQLQPDGIILDWQMPHRDGLAVLPLLRDVSPDSVIVMWSADADECLEHRALALGAAALIDKDPGRIADAVALIRRAVGGAATLSR